MDTILFDTIYEVRPDLCFQSLSEPTGFLSVTLFSSKKYKDKILVGLDDGFKYEKFDKIKRPTLSFLTL